MENFSKRLKQALTQAGMKQAELAEKIGAPRSAISQYCSGQNIPNAGRMADIAAATGVTLDFLQSGSLSPIAPAPSGWPDRITVSMAARCLRKSDQAVRINMQNGRLPIGRALQGTGSRWNYVIVPEKLREEVGESRFNAFFGLPDKVSG